MHPLPRIAALGLAAAAITASAGTVEVAYADPQNFADAGNSAWDEQANVEALARHLQSLGRLLPEGQTLKVELLDVDLAGQVRARGIGGVRTVSGRGDFPRMRLRYTLSVPGQPARTGEDAISDVDYARGLSSYRKGQPLFYEKRMLGNWFMQRFSPRVAQS